MRFEKFFKKNRNKIVTFLIDVALIHAAFMLAILITRADGLQRKFFFDDAFWIRYTVCIVVSSISLLIFNCYSGLIKYTGRLEVIRIIFAYAFTFVVLIALGYSVSAFSLYINFCYPFAISALSLSIAFRFTPWMFKYVNHIRRSDVDQKRAIIFGAGSAGMFLISQCISDKNFGHIPVAVIDDNEEKHGVKLSGVTVEGGRESLGEVIQRTKAEVIIIAIQNIKRSALKELYKECLKYNIPVKIMQTLDGLEVGNSAKLSDIRPEQLLGRDEFKVDRELVDSCVKDKVVLITGGTGSIGSELCRQALEFGCKHLVIFDMHENGMFDLDNELKKRFSVDRYTTVIGNVRDRSKLRKEFEKYKPNAVFHAAAYKHVPMMEINPIEAVKTNIFGTQNVIDQCEESGVEKFIFISTDKAVNPANIMGASKRIAEMLIQVRGKHSKVKMAAVRFGNVVGSSGSAIPFFLKQIAEGGPVTVTHKDIKRYFMTIPEAVRLVLQAGAFASSGQVFVLDMGEPVNIYSLAEDLIRLSGYEPNVDINIDIVGLRPGEKLFEELRFDDEAVDRTSHEGIFVTKLKDIVEMKLSLDLKKLTDAMEKEDEELLNRVIFEAVPSVYRVAVSGKSEVFVVDGHTTP